MGSKASQSTFLKSPLGAIFNSTGTLRHDCAKYLADVLAPLMGKIKQYPKNSQVILQICEVIESKSKR